MSRGYEYTAQMSMFGRRAVVGYVGKMCAVRVVGRDVANRVIIDNHYSGRIYTGSILHLGVYVGGRFVGVLQWGRAMNPASGASIVEGATIDQWLELNRMWIDDSAPRNTESSAIAASVKLIRRLYPQVAFLQSFADERCGGLGVVYQAASFGFYGEHVATFWELDGEWFHNTLATAKNGKQGKRGDYLQANIGRAIQHNLRQFRYLRFLKPWARRNCRLSMKPYPKRAGGGA